GRSDKVSAVDTITGGRVFVQDLRFYNRALDSIEVARVGLVHEYIATAADQRRAGQSDRLYEVFLDNFDKPSLKLRTELPVLKTEEDDLRQRGATTMVMEEKKEREPVA